jgi:hypothetical protein
MKRKTRQKRRRNARETESEESAIGLGLVMKRRLGHEENYRRSLQQK